MSALPPFTDPATGLTVDVTGMDLSPQDLDCFCKSGPQGRPSPIARAMEAMRQIESGAVWNIDEGRKVTHFTDRRRYPQTALYREVERFAEEIRTGGRNGSPMFDAVIMNGIGGSALGPQLLQFALNGPYWNELSADKRGGRPRIYFLDNTDPAGLRDVLEVVDLERTLTVTVSKSGKTRETLNNMLALAQEYAARNIPFNQHAAAVTMKDSLLWERAAEEKWLAKFPMPESIGGRTSVTSVVGHVPAAVTGIDYASFLAGACRMDELTRRESPAENPALQLAIAAYIAGNGRGDRNMVVVPYSDRLLLFGRYLQQLVMESLGKARDRDGHPVHQGLTVFGNKGGTDAHAYIQQLNDGRDDFFIVFIQILRDAQFVPLPGEPGPSTTMGDYLHAFKRGLIRALRERRRPVVDIVAPALDAYYLGMLIALFERFVALYAEFIDINAFHQPGVEAYKKAAGRVIDVHVRLTEWIAGKTASGWQGTAAEATAACGLTEPDHVAEVERLLKRYAVNERVFARHRIVVGDAPDLYRVTRADVP